MSFLMTPNAIKYIALILMVAQVLSSLPLYSKYCFLKNCSVVLMMHYTRTVTSGFDSNFQC